MKEIRLSDRAQLKMEILASHEIFIDPNFVIAQYHRYSNRHIG